MIETINQYKEKRYQDVEGEFMKRNNEWQY